MLNNCPLCTKFINDKCTALNSLQIINGACNKYSPDNISYYIHKYYRGILLPEVCEAMGESNLQFVHEFIIKPEFVYRQTGEYYFRVNKFSDIPEKHQSSARFIPANSKAQTENSIIGYVPSMSKFTKHESKLFIDFVEKLLFMELQGSIRSENEQEYKSLKERLK